MISVIIPARNAANTISESVTALNQQNVDSSEYEVIVLDDGSRDTSHWQAEKAGARVISVNWSGTDACRNTGIHEAQDSIISFTNADCVSNQDWIKQIIAPLSGPNIVGYKGVYSRQQNELVARFVQIEYEDKLDLSGFIEAA